MAGERDMTQVATETKILVVGEGQEVRLVLGRRLQGRGYTVETAGNGRQALEMAKRTRPDIVLAEATMSGMSGLDFLRAVRADQALRRLYVILVVSPERAADLAAVLESDADDYLENPWSEEELLARIRVGMRTCRLQEELAAGQGKAALAAVVATMAQEITQPIAMLENVIRVALRQPPSQGGLVRLLAGCSKHVERIATAAEVLKRLEDSPASAPPDENEARRPAPATARAGSVR